MSKRALSAAQVAALKAEGTHWVAPGLYLQIKPNGARSWLLRYGKGGKTFWHGLGAARDVPLKEARERAEELRVDIRRRDAHPVVERRDQRIEAKVAAATEAARAAPTFRWCAEQVIKQREHFHKSHYAQQQWPSSLRDHVYPHIGDPPVGQIGVREVHKVLSKIWTTKHPAAKKVRGRIARILDYAAAHGFRPDDNPARPNVPLDQLLPPVRHKPEHHPSAPYVEVPALVLRLRGDDDILAKAVLFVILTAVRSGEMRGALWSEFDLDTAKWVVPAERNKTSDDYIIPLAAQTVALLRTLPRKGKLVFPNPKTGKAFDYNKPITLLKEFHPDKTLHGFRATLSTWAREQTDYPAEVIEAALNHKQPDKVIAAYARTSYLDKRRALFQDWADYAFSAED